MIWNRPGHGERRVPACARDASHLAEGEPPEIRGSSGNFDGDGYDGSGAGT